MVRIRLLGELSVEVDRRAVEVPASWRARSLLGWLALNPGEHRRGDLAARFWPQILDANARASLRTSIWAIRRALGPAAADTLVATRDRIGISPGPAVWIDVSAFAELVGERRYEEALALCAGELLAGLDDDWIYEARDWHRDRMLDALGHLAGDAERSGDLDKALAWTRRQVELDPLGEGAQRELIRRLVAAGDPVRALATYQRLRERLRSEFGLAPSLATRELVRALAIEGRSGETRSTQLPRPLRFSPRAPFVGREPELARLRARWEEVAGGASAAVVLAGEAGIGKTRLAAEFARSLEGDGALVLYGRCDDGLAVPYQPFVHALRGYVQAIGLDRLRAELGRLAPELGRLLPELEGLGEPVRADPETERFALFEAIAALAEAASRDRRLLIVLDDLHWAANPTLLMLRHLIRSERPIGALVLGTYRETELEPGTPLARLLTDLYRDASATRVNIAGLDERGVRAMLEAAAGRELDDGAGDLVEALLTQTGGNPFYLGEVLVHLVESGAISKSQLSAADLAVPEELRQVIRERVARLPEQVRQVLGISAVAGATFSPAPLERVAGGEAHHALDQAVAAGLLVDAGRGDYAFAHALVRQTIYGGLGAARRARLHRRFGEALEALVDGDAHVEALAHHFAEAVGDGQVAKAVEYAIAAGRSAAARLGYEDAAAHYERGLDALALADHPDDDQRCELLIALGEARWTTGEIDTAREACLQAADLAARRGDSARLARAALAFAGPVRLEGAAAKPVAGLLERALAALGEQESALRARVMGRLAAALLHAGPRERPQALARDAVEVARRARDKTALASVLATSHWATWGPDNLDERVATATELAALATELGDDVHKGLAHAWLSADLLEAGDMDGCEREQEALERLAEALRQRYPRFVAALGRARQAHLEGRLEQSEALAREALALGLEGKDEYAMHAFGSQIMFVRREQGLIEERADEVRAYAERYRELPIWQCYLVYVCAELGRDADARAELDALAFADVPRDELWLVCMSVLSEAVASLGDTRRAEQLYGLLLPFADRCAVLRAANCQGSVSRPLGLLATAMSRLDDAARHFTAALEMNARIRSRLWVARTQHDYAACLLRRGDRDEALALLDQALATAEHLGLRDIADRAARLRLEAAKAASAEQA